MNPLADAQCTYVVLNNTTVIFQFDLNAYPALRAEAVVRASLSEIASMHSGAKTAEYEITEDLLTIVVRGTVNPVHTRTTFEQE